MIRDIYNDVEIQFKHVAPLALLWWQVSSELTLSKENEKPVLLKE